MDERCPESETLAAAPKSFVECIQRGMKPPPPPPPPPLPPPTPSTSVCPCGPSTCPQLVEYRLRVDCRFTKAALPCAGHEKVLEGACDQLEPFLLSQMVGQNMAIQQFSDAVCDHLSKQHPQKPLVVSAHGSPGVGKSFLPKLAAKALYNREPQLDLECPGMDCAGLKVGICISSYPQSRAVLPSLHV